MNSTAQKQNHISQFKNYYKVSHRRKSVPRKEPKILDSAKLHCVSSFRRNYNKRLLKLAHMVIFPRFDSRGCMHEKERSFCSGYGNGFDRFGIY